MNNTASTDNTLLDLHNASYDTQPHSIIVNYPLIYPIIGYKLLPKKHLKNYCLNKHLLSHAL